jgi:hypothetical protein
VVTAAALVAQAWRNGGRQARLARLLPMIEIRTTGLPEACAAGELLAGSGTIDVLDALVHSSRYRVISCSPATPPIFECW